MTAAAWTTTAGVVLAASAASASVALLVPGLPSVRPSADVAAGSAERTGAGRDGALLRVVSTVAVALGAAFFLGGSTGVVAGLLAATVCWWVVGRLEPPSVRRRRERLVASVPHAVDLLAACLAVGLSPAAAVEQIAVAVDPPLADELAAICSRLRLGADPSAVWRDVARHPQLGALGRTVSSGRGQRSLGRGRHGCGCPTTCAAAAGPRWRAGHGRWE